MHLLGFPLSHSLSLWFRFFRFASSNVHKLAPQLTLGRRGVCLLRVELEAPYARLMFVIALLSSLLLCCCIYSPPANSAKQPGIKFCEKKLPNRCSRNFFSVYISPKISFCLLKFNISEKTPILKNISLYPAKNACSLSQAKSHARLLVLVKAQRF
jgi:hypothetical protein